jgi:hypothetical protein
MRSRVLLAALLALSGCTVQFNAGDEQGQSGRSGSQEEQAGARASAEQVLSQLDRGDWKPAWEASSGSLRESANLPQFVAGVQSTRVAFGTPISRAVKGFNFTTSIDGAPSGEYAIVFFNTAFSGAGEVEEQVVLARERGTWRLAGYWAEKKSRVSVQ